MIQITDFLSSISKGRAPTAAEVHYKNKVVVYAARDFDKIRFPVQKVILLYGEGKCKYIGNGEYVSCTRVQVRPVKQ